MFKKFSAAKAALAAMVFSLITTGAAFAETGGGSIVDAAELETTISGATTTIGTVGMAILAVLAAIMVYRLVKGIMGR